MLIILEESKKSKRADTTISMTKQGENLIFVALKNNRASLPLAFQGSVA